MSLMEYFFLGYIIITFALYFVFDKQKEIDISQLKRISNSYREDCDKEFKEKLSNNVKYEKQIKELKDLYERAYYINKFWDVILREIFNIYGNKVRLSEITFLGEQKIVGENSIFKFGVSVNVPSPPYLDPRTSEYIEDVPHLTQYFELLIPDKETSIDKRYGKALYNMKIKF